MLLPTSDPLGARAEVRARLAAGLDEDVEIRIADGVYRLTEPLVLTAADSGRPGRTVTWTAAAGARPVFCGGMPVTGWRPAGDGRWTARVPPQAGIPRQLYIDGRRADWARGDWLDRTGAAVGPEGVRGADALGIAGWRRPSDAELVFRVRWRDYHCPIAGIDGDLIRMVEPCWTNSLPGTGRVGPFWDNTAVGTDVHDWSLYAVNALELLTTPGTFVWDSADRTVTYLPRPDEDLTTAEVLAPAAEQLLVLDGAHHVTVQGLTFAHTAWRQPSGPDGYAGAQAGFTLTGATGPLGQAGSHYTKPLAALTVRGGRRITVRDCRFTGLGGAGAVLEAGTKDSTVTGCSFTSISSGGVYVGDLDPHPRPELADERNTVSFTTIRETGLEFTDSVGVWAGYTRDLTVEHNTIEHLPYSGISVGWGWNQPEAQDPWLGGATIHANRIVDVLRVATRQFDGGAVYTQGPQPGTVIAANHIDRSEHGTTARDGNGVYLDEQSSHITVTGNVVTRVGYKWVSNWAEYGIRNHAHGNWTDNTVTPPLSGEGSTMRDNHEGLTELPPQAVRVAERAGAGPWPAPVEPLGAPQP